MGEDATQGNGAAQATSSALPRAYLAVAVLCNLPWLVTTLLGMTAQSSATLIGMALGLALSLGAVVVGRHRLDLRIWGPLAAGTLLATLVLPPLMAAKVVDALVIATDSVPVVSLAQMRKQSLAVVTIEDGIVRTDLMGVDLASSRTEKSVRAQQGLDVYAAPLVGGDFAPGTPVDVWLLCGMADSKPAAETERLCIAQMRQTPIVGRPYLAERDSPSLMPTAATHALKQHGLTVPSELVVVEVTGNLHGWAIRMLLLGFALIVGLNALPIWALRSLSTPARR